MPRRKKQSFEGFAICSDNNICQLIISAGIGGGDLNWIEEQQEAILFINQKKKKKHD
jgi:hypothetical protein